MSGRAQLTRKEKKSVAEAMRQKPSHWTVRQHVAEFDISPHLAEVILEDFAIPHARSTSIDGALSFEGARRIRHAMAKDYVAEQVALAKAEAETTKPFKSGPLEW